MHPKIPAPENVAQEPDAATRAGLTDQTGPRAENRVFYMNLGFFRYGTDDKVHAASFVLSIFLLACTIGFYAAGFRTKDTQWAGDAAHWFGSTFLFVAGVAIGKASGGRSDQPSRQDD